MTMALLQFPLNQDRRSADDLAKILHGLYLIGNMEEIRPALEWLENQSKHLAKSCCSEIDDRVMLRKQGAVLMIDELIKQIGEAETVRERMAQKPSPMAVDNNYIFRR
jgi:predicted transcriptional regulator